MAQLPDDLILKIMMYNRHPLAEIFHEFMFPYRMALQIQRESLDEYFRKQPIPSFMSWKKHGIGCKEWADLFDFRRMECGIVDQWGIVLIDERWAEILEEWRMERACLRDYEYRL